MMADATDVSAIGAVLWDMDGTLVDTEPYWIEREHEVVAEYGNGRWTDAQAHALVGFDLRDSASYISRQGDVDLPIDDIVHLLLDGVIQRVQHRIPWRPGARELLDELSTAGIATALVTMSWRRFTDAVIAALPDQSFGTVVAGDDVVNGKPHPEPYTTAAARLRVAPDRCIAIEDSPTGVRSAIAAGCFVIGVPHVVPIPRDLGHHELGSLEGVGVDDLLRLMTSCHRVDRGA